MSNTVKTPKGTVLPLISLKGKDYLQVAHRLQWFNEAEERFNINTNFLLVNDDQTIAQAIVTAFNKDGQVVKSVTATKRETKKDFSDHTEKAETGAIGRALALMGYGTQFAISDLDEGSRLADSPVTNVKVAAKAELKPTNSVVGTRINNGGSGETVFPGSTEGTAVATPKISTFRKAKPAEAKPEAKTDEWT